MQRSLSNFAGFEIKKKDIFFNPFGNEALPEASGSGSGETQAQAQTQAKAKAKKSVEVINILDAPERKEVVNLFPTGSEAAAKGPDGTRPDGTRPDGTRPDGTRPDGTRPDGTRPEATRPDGTRPEATRPEATRPDGTRPEATRPEAKTPNEKTVIEETAFVEMIQPKAKDGSRLLYKYPRCPRVGVKGAYTLLVGESDRSEAAWLIQFDGAANPNPGPASAGAVLWSPKDLDGRRNPVFESGKYLGKATNNIAEVQGLLLGLQIAATRGARELLIEGDSELIIFQQTGRYRVSDKNLKRWWAEIQAAMMDETAFDWIAIRQVSRELNERADSITKEVLSRKASFQRA